MMERCRKFTLSSLYEDSEKDVVEYLQELHTEVSWKEKIRKHRIHCFCSWQRSSSKSRDMNYYNPYLGDF